MVEPGRTDPGVAGGGASAEGRPVRRRGRDQRDARARRRQPARRAHDRGRAGRGDPDRRGRGDVVQPVYALPTYIQPAGDAIHDLCGRFRRLLTRIGGDLRTGASRKHADAWMQEARALDGEIVQADAALLAGRGKPARLNPRAARHALNAGTRPAQRPGLAGALHGDDAVGVRAACSRYMTEESEPVRERLSGGRAAAALDNLLGHMADAVGAFGQMVTAEISAQAEEAEGLPGGRPGPVPRRPRRDRATAALGKRVRAGHLGAARFAAGERGPDPRRTGRRQARRTAPGGGRGRGGPDARGTASAARVAGCGHRRAHGAGGGEPRHRGVARPSLTEPGDEPEVGSGRRFRGSPSASARASGAAAGAAVGGQPAGPSR
ncbi:hypothetical protein ACU686_36935 [Yinghuangia aomiensis]